jgi:hypothetical protein
MDIILVHGGLHGSWRWDLVIRLLEKSGFSVAPPEPRHGWRPDTPRHPVPHRPVVTVLPPVHPRLQGAVDQIAVRGVDPERLEQDVHAARQILVLQAAR